VWFCASATVSNCAPKCSRHSSWTAWPLKIRPIGCPLVTNYKCTMSNIQEEQRCSAVSLSFVHFSLHLTQGLSLSIHEHDALKCVLLLLSYLLGNKCNFQSFRKLMWPRRGNAAVFTCLSTLSFSSILVFEKISMIWTWIYLYFMIPKQVKTLDIEQVKKAESNLVITS
jgi:hypothetical protein